jgi:5-hydroxyisourate hydrolase-like protein (transthyretin family)
MGGTNKMKRNLISKVVVFGMIALCMSVSVVSGTNGSIWTISPGEEEYQYTSQISDENSMICGYVNDRDSGVPLANVDVEQDWWDSQGHYGWNSTQTNATGFYYFNTAAVDFQLYFTNEDYFREYSSTMSIGEHEILWYNISMIPIPPETVYFYGVITDNSSGEPVEGADIDIYWYDTEGHSWNNDTQSNSSGYYCLGAIPGETYITVYYDNYFRFYSEELFTENDSLIWYNISLIPFPSVSAIVCGYITDAQTGDPIPDASVNLHCYVEHGYFSNYTHTNGIGFYSLGTIPGSVDLYVYKLDYASSYSDNHLITEDETLWMNLTLEYEPMETSLLKGYVVDSETSSVVRNAFIRYDWKDDVGHFSSDYTFSDQKGFYSIPAPKGTIQLMITANGYTNQQSSWFDIDEYTELWFNTTLTPEITLKITKPQPGVYINNESRFPMLSKFISRFLPGFPPLIIGPIEITVNITRSTMGCNRVEFYIDHKYMWTDVEAPFTYYWRAIGFSKHVIKVIAYDNAGPCTIETLTVRKII